MNKRVRMIDDQPAVRDVACAFLERDKLIVGGANDAPRPRRGLHVRWGSRIAQMRRERHGGLAMIEPVYSHDAFAAESEI